MYVSVAASEDTRAEDAARLRSKIEADVQVQVLEAEVVGGGAFVVGVPSFDVDFEVPNYACGVEVAQAVQQLVRPAEGFEVRRTVIEERDESPPEERLGPEDPEVTLLWMEVIEPNPGEKRVRVWETIELNEDGSRAAQMICDAPVTLEPRRAVRLEVVPDGE